jgi:hypothetical protein
MLATSGNPSQGADAMQPQNDPSEPLLTQGQIPSFVTEVTGIPIGVSTVKKLCAPSIGDGPRPAAWFGKRPLYERAEVLRWAKARLTATPRPTPHNWPAKPSKPPTRAKQRARPGA